MKSADKDSGPRIAANRLVWEASGAASYLARSARLGVLLIIGGLVLGVHLYTRLVSATVTPGPFIPPEDSPYYWLSGAVQRPGLYEAVNHPTLLAAAPGLATLQLIENGTMVPVGIHPQTALLFFRPLPLNEADATLLAALPGVGPVLAGRIVAMRRKLDGFKSIEQLRLVSGIGPVMFERLRDLLTVTMTGSVAGGRSAA